MRPALLVVMAPLLGCTATVSTYQLVSADDAVRRAAAAGAAEAAPYEYTLATLYLEKAREEAGYSEYRTARELATRAATLADEAVMKMQSSTEKTSFERLEDPQAAPVEAPSVPIDWDKVVQKEVEEEERRRREEGVDIDDLLDDDAVPTDDPTDPAEAP